MVARLGRVVVAGVLTACPSRRFTAYLENGRTTENAPATIAH